MNSNLFLVYWVRWCY